MGMKMVALWLNGSHFPVFFKLPKTANTRVPVGVAQSVPLCYFLSRAEVKQPQLGRLSSLSNEHHPKKKKTGQVKPLTPLGDMKNEFPPPEMFDENMNRCYHPLAFRRYVGDLRLAS